MAALKQIRVIDKSGGLIAQFHTLHARLAKGEVQISNDLATQVNDMMLHNKQLFSVRLATPTERQELGLTQPAMLMEASRTLNDILAKVRCELSGRPGPQPVRVDARRLLP